MSVAGSHTRARTSTIIPCPPGDRYRGFLCVWSGAGVKSQSFGLPLRDFRGLRGVV